jgi:uncharacterized protein
MSEQGAPLPNQTTVADPAPLGLAGFALTTFVLSVHNANWAPDLIWVGLALFYGGLAQFMAGMMEFRNKNTFGATAFTSYGAFWLALGAFVIMNLAHAIPATLNGNDALAWFAASFAIFNTYMLLGATRLSKAVFSVFFTLEVTLIIFFIGQFEAGSGHVLGTDLIHVAGYVGVLTAACAWYASAAGVVNSLTDHAVVPVGTPLWRGSTAPLSRGARADAGGYSQAVPQH